MTPATHALWQPLVTHGATWCAPNIHADCRWLDVDGEPWAVSVTRPSPRNCYVVSATGQYLDYALEETRRLPTPVTRTMSVFGLQLIAPVLRRLDPVVVLDALPVSTVLHAARSTEQWVRALDVARGAFPGLPIVIRSLDAVHTPTLLASLDVSGVHRMPSRLVFHQDPREAEFWRIRNVRHDVQLSRGFELATRTLVLDDVPDIAALYWLLYGEKHSRLNPAFSTAWLSHGMQAGVLTGEGIEHDGRLVAAYLSFHVHDVMTNPVFGYDTRLPQSLGLYRRLSLLTMQHARTHGLRLHASSGAPGFKASRGGVPTIEYHAVDLRSVRGSQRAAWTMALRVATALGPRMLAQAT